MIFFQSSNMKKILLSVLGFGALVTSAFAKVHELKCVVDKQFMTEGYHYSVIDLQHLASPLVKISNIIYEDNVTLPEGAKVGNPEQPVILLGKNKKQPFATIKVPAYVKNANGTYSKVAYYELTATEEDKPATSTVAQKTTVSQVSSSVLSTGTWYKVGITKTGLFRIDYAALKAMGVDPASIQSANIRVYGNGGNMLPTGNNVPRISDLKENAIWVNDGGDNAINAGDYFVFYGVGPTAWVKDSINQKFIHQKNIYSDTAYYFITFDNGAGLRIAEQTATLTPTTTASGFNYYAVHDTDVYNPVKGGRTWYGEQFMKEDVLSHTINFDLEDNISNLNYKIALATRQKYYGSTFTTYLNGSQIAYNIISNKVDMSETSILIVHQYQIGSYPINSSTASFRIDNTPPSAEPGCKAYLDYIEVQGIRSLNITRSQLLFRDWSTVGAGKVVSYPLNNANGFTQVWDVTDPQVPVKMKGSLAGSTYTFMQNADRLHEFAAMNNPDMPTPYFIAKIDNQNLHALAQADMIIVSAPEFVKAANTLADFHRNKHNYRVNVATTDLIYNEFSSGAQDICAIRDFVKMFYDRAGSSTTDMPRYLLLFGGASYDYKDRVASNCNFVPTYESFNDSTYIGCYSGDDVYGFLDDNEDLENFDNPNTMDIGLGRLPARNINDANVLVNKIIHYKDPQTLGPWRLSSMFVGDLNDGAGDHMQDAEYIAGTQKNVASNRYNQQKVYVNAIPLVSTPGGTRAPNANAAIDDQIYKGTFLINYNGHGNTEVWSHYRILTKDNYNSWKNKYMLPFMVTATCDFGQFDHPEFVSAAEAMLNKVDGGVIATVTTTQAVFASYNKPMNAEYIQAQFTRNADESWNSFGDAYRMGKNIRYVVSTDAFELANYRKFTLLGDPALVPNFPDKDILIDSVLDGNTGELTDTFKALGKYTIKGSIRNNTGAVIDDFNGLAYISIYDKPRTVTTINNVKINYSLQDNLVYKGRATVTNGYFSLTFITPKDINYNYGKAKISSYAHNGDYDASGMDTTTVLGGYSENPVLNDNPPIVRPYINDSLFINGGITGSNTSLFVALKSETGINVSGYSIGHDLTAVLDDNIESPYVLNDNYETAPNTYQLGYVNYPLTGLEDGVHTITVKAWDVNNNSGTGSVDFVVIDGKVVSIESLGNYPNPFSNNTHFVFEHNHPNENMDISIQIYDVAGKLARNIDKNYAPSGSRTVDITWDGTDNSGNQLAPGIYVYRLNITTDKGYKASAYQKLVIVR